jgi:hypothetical protein
VEGNYMQAEDNRHYYARSLALLKHDKGWIKPILVLSSALFVPIVGALGVLGYIMEWARLTAWGFDASPKQKNVKIGHCIKSGWRAFIAGLGVAVLLFVIDWLIGKSFESIKAESIGRFISIVIDVLSGTIIFVVSLHAVIYQDFKAGYCFRKIFSMLKQDFGGIARIAGLSAVISLIVALLVGAIFALVLVNLFTRLLSYFPMLEYTDTISGLTVYEGFMLIAALLSLIKSYALAFAALLFLINLGVVFIQIIIINAVGLWMRQFNVSTWGNSSTPLPTKNTVSA